MTEQNEFYASVYTLPQVILFII